MGPTGAAVVALLMIAIVLCAMAVATVMLVVALGATLFGALVRLVVWTLGALLRASVAPLARRRNVPAGEPLWRFLDDRVPRTA